MCAVGFSPGTPLANALGNGVLGTLVSRPQMGGRGRRRSMRAGHERSQDAVLVQMAPWGEIRQQPSRTDPEPRKNTVSAGVKNISPPISTLYIKRLRTASGAPAPRLQSLFTLRNRFARADTGSAESERRPTRTSWEERWASAGPRADRRETAPDPSRGRFTLAASGSGAAVASRSASHESSNSHFQTSIIRILLRNTSSARPDAA